MATTTRFTNNVLRAKAVKLLTPKRGNNTSKFTNKVIRGKTPAINDYPGQTVPGHQGMLISGGPAQMSVHTNVNKIKRG